MGSTYPNIRTLDRQLFDFLVAWPTHFNINVNYGSIYSLVASPIPGNKINVHIWPAHIDHLIHQHDSVCRVFHPLLDKQWLVAGYVEFWNRDTIERPQGTHCLKFSVPRTHMCAILPRRPPIDGYSIEPVLDALGTKYIYGRAVERNRRLRREDSKYG